MAFAPPSAAAAVTSSAAKRVRTQCSWARGSLTRHPFFSELLLLFPLLLLLATETTPRCHAAAGLSSPRGSSGVPSGEALALREALGALGALERALSFFEANYQDINLDGLLGTVVVQAQLELLLELIERKGATLMNEGVDHDLKEVTSLLRSLQRQARHLNGCALPVVRHNFPKYNDMIGGLLTTRLWAVPLASRSLANASWLLQESPLPHDLALNDEERTAALLGHEEQMKESRSDECISNVLGVLRHYRLQEGRRWRGRSAHCAITKQCWRDLTAPAYSGYSLTHQVFFLIIAKQVGCGGLLEGLARADGFVSVDRLLLSLCNIILQEAHALADHGPPVDRRDLFMEQGSFCGLLGFRDFFSTTWLQRVLAWQRPSGCYGDVNVWLASLNREKNNRGNQPFKTRRPSPLHQQHRQEQEQELGHRQEQEQELGHRQEHRFQTRLQQQLLPGYFLGRDDLLQETLPRQEPEERWHLQECGLQEEATRQEERKTILVPGHGSLDDDGNNDIRARERKRAGSSPEGDGLLLLGSRVRREEQGMAGSCLAHQTTLAATFLVNHVKFILLDLLL